MSTNTQNSAPLSSEPVDWQAVETRITEFVGEYEMVGEDEQGRDGRYIPNESERALISDAIHGLLADDELMALILPAAPVAAQARPTDDALWDQTLRERDEYHDMADQLAAQIASITGQEIGEHSSDNEPWCNAILAADEFIAERIRKLCSAPAQPDLTQQTLDDVKAGIPARDAEITALRKEIEVLRACAVPAETLRVCGVIADKIEDGSLFIAGIYRNKDLAGFVRQVLSSVSITQAQQPVSGADGLPKLTDSMLDAAAEYIDAHGICIEPDQMEGIVSAALAQQPARGADQLPPLPTPDSYLFQHEETGLTQCVDGQQVEGGFEKNNPRHQRIGGMFTESQMQGYARAALAQQDATLQAEVLGMVLMLEANEWADHCGKSDLGQRLEWAITALQNRIAELTKSSSQQDADKVDAERYRALKYGPTLFKRSYSGDGAYRAIEYLPLTGEQLDSFADAARKETI